MPAPGTGGRGAAGTSASRAVEGYRFELYVAGNSPNGVRAEENLRRVLDAHIGGAYTLDVIDVLREPDRAEAARVLAAPTLIKLRPDPVRRAIGDFKDGERLLSALDIPQGPPDGPRGPPAP